MFTGLIQHVGTVASIAAASSRGARLSVDLGPLASTSKPGDSIAIDGCCLTIAELSGSLAAFDAVPETLRRTTLGTLKPGARVNLECALRPADRVGGHFVQGHVDTTAVVIRAGGGEGRRASAEWHFQLEDLKFAEQIVEKGSIAVDGISLTVAGCERSAGTFWVALIPETLARTTIASKRKGARVNVETDMLGKYVLAALRAVPGQAPGTPAALNESWMREQGY
jgi:riboflavin synthase